MFINSTASKTSLKHERFVYFKSDWLFHGAYSFITVIFYFVFLFNWMDGECFPKWYLSSCHKVVPALCQGGGKHLGRIEAKQRGPFMTSPCPYSQIFGVIILLKYCIMPVYSSLNVAILLVFNSNYLYFAVFPHGFRQEAPSLVGAAHCLHGTQWLFGRLVLNKNCGNICLYYSRHKASPCFFFCSL